MQISKTRVRRIKAGLNQPFTISLGSHKFLDNVLFTVELQEGTAGFGEAAVASHITGETIEQTQKNLRLAGEWLAGKNISDYSGICHELGDMLNTNRCALAAAEMAVLDALTKSCGMPLWKLFGGKCEVLHTDITIVIGSPEEAEKAAKKIRAMGVKAIKIKVGRSFDEDIERVVRAHRAAPKCSIYLDANQGFTAEQAFDFITCLKKKGIIPELYEQPVKKDDLDGMRFLTRKSWVPICADETAYSLADVVKVIRTRAAHVVNIKLMKTGIMKSAEIARLCMAKGVGLMMGGMMETRLAMTCSAHIAFGMGGFDYIDLDTPFFIKDELMKGAGPDRHGVYDLRNVREGIGVVPR